MQYEIILGFWLLCIFFGCCGLYCFATYAPARVKAVAEALQQVEVVVPAFQAYDFRNTDYAFAWCDAFHRNNGRDVNSYLGLMVKKYDFAMPGKECIEWWQGMIKDTKPQSPTHLAYYEHIRIEKPVLRHDKDFDVHITCKPDYPSYGGNGFGKVFMPSISSAIRDYSVNQWIAKHYEKYPNGILPEQTIEKKKVTI